MKPLILNGKIVRDHVATQLIQDVRSLSCKPTVAIVQVGDLPESSAFIRQKKLFGEKIGVIVVHLQFPKEISEQELVTQIKKLNKDKKVQGIVVQLPLTDHISKDAVIEAIDPIKDTDGLHSVNVKKLWANDSTGIIPATARGVMTLCKFYNINLIGKNVVVIGRSTLVGKPLAHSFINANATVTIAHSRTRNLAKLTQQADILVVAAGVKKLIGSKHVKKGQIIIDVGIHVVEGSEHKIIVGDVDFDRVSKIVKAITPVPGGVGPLTVASLFQNVVESAKTMLL